MESGVSFLSPQSQPDQGRVPSESLAEGWRLSSGRHAPPGVQGVFRAPDTGSAHAR